MMRALKSVLSRSKVQVERALSMFKSDSLFRNAAFLMASTAITSALGFGFWFFVAHLYSPEQIGSASALIAISLLISNLSYLGLDSGLIRFLPSSRNQSKDINAALLIVGGMAAVAALAYVLLRLGTNIAFFNASVLGVISFVVFMVVVVLNSLTDNVFIANRRAEYHTATYTILAFTKLVLPLFLVPLGSFGIYTAYAMASLVSLGLSFFLMARAAGYQPLTSPNWGFISSSRKYAASNYIANLLSGLPSQVMPTLIIARLGEAQAAYYSMAWTMVNLLYIVPSATSNSLLAESSHNEDGHDGNLNHAVKILSVILLPCVLLALVSAHFWLGLFGARYAAGGTKLFQLLAVATFFVAANYLAKTSMNLRHRGGSVVLVQAIIAALTIGLAWPLVHYGLVGIGIATLIGYAGGTTANLLLGLRHRYSDTVLATAPGRPVIAAFAREFGLGAAQISEDLGGGDRSATVLLTTASGDRYVLKVYNVDKHSPQQIETQVDFAQYLFGLGIPVPKLIPSHAGRLVSNLSVDSEKWVGILMGFESGQHPSAFSNRLLENMATVQGKIHQGGQLYAASHDTSSLKHKMHNKATFLPFVPRGLSHFDYYYRNLLVDKDDISCVIDFEGTRSDALVACIYYSLTKLYDGLRDKSKLELYLRSYQSVRKLNWVERLIIRLSLALRFRSPRLLSLRIAA